MKSNRRSFLRSVPPALGTGAIALASKPNQDANPACLDYGLSFLCNKASFNAVRFWIESRTTVVDDQAKTSQVYYQCASCKSEHTFAEENLFIEDNYDFLPILGNSTWLIFRRPCRISDRYRVVQESVWGEPDLKLRFPSKVRELDSFEEIRDATAAGLPIVAQTEIGNQETQLRAVIEFPVKTMNVSLDDSLYQVDTGPVAYPDLSKRFDTAIECLSLAFVAFNAPHFADFVVEQPTPVIQEETELAKVYHYSNPFSRPARNRLLALELPE